MDGVANSQEKFLETNTIWNHEVNVVERQFAVSLLYFYMMFWVYQQRKVITTQPEPFLRVVLAACNLDGWGNVFSETKSELAYCQEGGLAKLVRGSLFRERRKHHALFPLLTSCSRCAFFFPTQPVKES